MRLINIDLRWDSNQGIVTGAVGRFHRSPSQYLGVEIKGLSVPYDKLDWNSLSRLLDEECKRSGREPT